MSRKKDPSYKITLCKNHYSKNLRFVFRYQNDLAQQYECYSIALDESTDSTQVAIFIRRIDPTFAITEESASLVSRKDTTIDLNIFQAIKSVIGLNLSNICG